MNKTYYCDHCGRHGYGYAGLKNTTATRIVRGEEINVHYEPVMCEHCGHELYDEDRETEITQKAIEAYRRKMKLLAPKDLEKLLAKFGAKELADKVKCSVSEIVNSAHGSVHSRKTDKALRRLLDKGAA